MGRPETLIVRLTASEKRELKRRATAAGSSMSDIAREAIFSDGNPHIDEFILRTISKIELNENAVTKLVGLLEDIRAFQDSSSPEVSRPEVFRPKVFRLVENQFLEIIDDCATLKRRLRDDVVEYRRVAGLPPTAEPPHTEGLSPTAGFPPTGEPQHDIRPYEQTSAEHEQSLAEEEDIKEETILRIMEYIKREKRDEVVFALVWATLEECQKLLGILENSASQGIDEDPKVKLASGEDVELYDSTTGADDMAESDETLLDETLLDEVLSDETLLDQILSGEMILDEMLPDEGADDENVATEKAETPEGDVRGGEDDVEIQKPGRD